MTFVPSASKADAIDRFNAILGLSEILGVGSSVPRAIFDAAAWEMGVNSQGSMPEVGREIVESAGLRWTAECDSTSTESGGGSTVTLVGLNAMLEALESRRAS